MLNVCRSKTSRWVRRLEITGLLRRDGFEDFEYHWISKQLVEKLRAADKPAASVECVRVLRDAVAFLLAPDNCAYIEPSCLYQGRRLSAEAIERVAHALETGSK